jgi:hypothetical protein
MITFHKHLKYYDLQPGQVYWGYLILDIDSEKILLQSLSDENIINYYSLSTQKCLSDDLVPLTFEMVQVISDCYASRMLDKIQQYYYNIIKKEDYIRLRIDYRNGYKESILFISGSSLTYTTGISRNGCAAVKISGICSLVTPGKTEILLNLNELIKVYIEEKDNWTNFIKTLQENRYPFRVVDELQ